MSTPTTHRRAPRIRTIVWGAILVGIAVFSILAIFAGPLGPAAVLWSIVGFGGLLVIAAVLAIIVRAARRAPKFVPAAATAALPTAGIETFTERAEPAEPSEPANEDQPIG